MSRRRTKRHCDETGRTLPPLPAYRENCPTPRKLAFDTETQAVEVMKYAAHDGRTFKPCRAYRCECGFWHTSSVPYGYTMKPKASGE